jgi:hypothetical protein
MSGGKKVKRRRRRVHSCLQIGRAHSSVLSNIVFSRDRESQPNHEWKVAGIAEFDGGMEGLQTTLHPGLPWLPFWINDIDMQIVISLDSAILADGRHPILNDLNVFLVAHFPPHLHNIVAEHPFAPTRRVPSPSGSSSQLVTTVQTRRLRSLRGFWKSNRRFLDSSADADSLEMTIVGGEGNLSDSHP